MKEPTLGNPQNTIAVLQKYNFIFQKKFGQNFLIDTHVLDKIIRAAEIGKDDLVLEIGPGIGTMTQYLSCAAGKVIAVEIDRALIPILGDTLDASFLFSESPLLFYFFISEKEQKIYRLCAQHIVYRQLHIIQEQLH